MNYRANGALGVGNQGYKIGWIIFAFQHSITPLLNE